MIKRSPDDLAVFGGPVAFDTALHVGRPNIGDRARLLGRINDLLDRRWLTNGGPVREEFERAVAALVGVRHCIATCNGTVALEIAIRACAMSGEVIIPSFTFVATAHALQWQEITPIFCDVDPRTHTLDPAQVEARVTRRTTGIIGVHLWGRACDVDALAEIALRRRLRLLFDAAHAFGCSYRGRMIGQFGDAEVFSFHATKVVNTFEGGAIVTDDDHLAARMRLMKNFGFAGEDRVVALGINGKMSEVSAAMGVTSLESLPEFVAVNQANHDCYRVGLAGLTGVTLLAYEEAERCNYQYVVLEIDEDLAQVTRDDLHQILRAENVRARRYFYPGCHRMEPYRSLYPAAGRDLPNTEWLARRILCLPTGTTVSTGEIDRVCEIVRTAVTHGAEVHDRLGRTAPRPLGTL